MKHLTLVRCLDGYPAVFVCRVGEDKVAVRSNGTFYRLERREWLALPLHDPYAPGNGCPRCQQASGGR